MARENERPPESPTAIGMSTGMDVPGLQNVRGPLEEVLATGRPASPDRSREETLEQARKDDVVMAPIFESLLVPPAPILDVVPGQSGAEGLGELPHGGDNDPYDGP